MTTKTATLNVKLSQQALNLLTQIAAAVGWAETVVDIYEGGKLLADGGLPKLEPTDWIKSNEEVAQMNKEERDVYTATDKAWAAKVMEFTLTGKQVEVLEKAFKSVVKKGALSPNAYWIEIIEALGWKVD